ncbi:MAG: aspartate aminotransferase family protein [Thermincolia bacterium]
MARLFRFMGLGTVEWEGRGTVIRDIHGKEYLDCLGGYGVFNIGHSHPKVVEAVREQLERMPLGAKVFFSRPMAQLAQLLAEITPGDLKYSFFCNSGTEAVEGALKLSRLHTGKHKVIAAYNGFHGKTLGALSATGRDVFRQPCEPLLPGFVHVPFGDADAVEGVIDDSTAAVIVEPVQGEGGIIIPENSYLGRLREICDCHGALLILDEVQTGLGRTGKMFAADHYGVVPDIMTLAKALGGGVMPLGAFIARPRIWDVFETSPFLHTSTFGGNPLACAAGVATIRVVLEENLADKARLHGQYFLQKLKFLEAKYPEVVAEARGMGLLLGLELTREGMGGLVMAELIDAGIIAAYTLNNPKVIRLEPPLLITVAEIDRVVAVLESALAKADEIREEL